MDFWSDGRQDTATYVRLQIQLLPRSLLAWEVQSYLLQASGDSFGVVECWALEFKSSLVAMSSIAAVRDGAHSPDAKTIWQLVDCTPEAVSIANT